jgi:hypothetical protein
MESRPHRELSSEPTTEERIEQLKRQRDELILKEEEQALLQEIQRREYRLSGIRDSAPSLRSDVSSPAVPTPDDDEPPAQRRRLDDARAATPGRGPKIEKIPMFEGKGVREYQDFESRLLIAFRLDPTAFALEDQKIAFTLQYLQRTFRQLWIQRELEADGETLSWRHMMDFLLDQLKSPINRELHITLQYSRATQKEGQSVNEFAAYLSTLENQIQPPYEQKHLVMHLYSKLQPQIRIALSNYGDFPKTRRELVERAATLEDNLQRAKGKTASRSHTATPSAPSPRPRITPTLTKPGAKPTSSQRPQGGSSASTCFYCNKPGHWAQDCKKKAYDEKQGRGPATGVNAITPAKKQ